MHPSERVPRGLTFLLLNDELDAHGRGDCGGI